MKVNTNIPALNIWRSGANSNRMLTASLKKLSTGLRINSAADDAAGLVIAEKMSGQYGGLNRASLNAQDGINMFQTAEGALVETTSILHRMRELSVQSTNGVLTANDRQEIEKEVTQLKDEIDRIALTTEFNTKKLLDGTSTALWSTDKVDVVSAVIKGKVTEGNYKITVDISAPATNQVWQSDVMSLKEDYARNITASYTETRYSLNSGNTVSNIITASNSISATTTAAVVDAKFEFVQGTAAELVATATANLTISETSYARLTSAASASAQYVIQFTADATVGFDDGAATDVVFSAGSTWTQAEIGQALSALDAGGNSQASFDANHNLTIDTNGNTAIWTFDAAAQAAFGMNASYTFGAATASAVGTAVAEQAYVFQFAGAAGTATALQTNTTMRFEINGTNVDLDIGRADSYLSALTTVSFTEDELLDAFNTALQGSGNENLSAEIGIDHKLNIVVQSSATSTVQSIQLTGSEQNGGSATYVAADLFADATSTTTGEGKIRFTVNSGTTTLSASLTAGIYTSADSLAVEVERAMRAAVDSAASNTVITDITTTNKEDFYVDVFVDDTDNYMHIMSQKVGANSEVELLYGAQNDSALPGLGLAIDDHAQGNNEGISMKLTDNNTGDLLTHIYNRRGETDGAVNWDAAGAVTDEISGDRNLSGIKVDFKNIAMSVGDYGNFKVERFDSGDKDYIAKATDTLSMVSRFYDNDGNFMLREAQKITVIGNGKTADVWLDKADTLGQVQTKIQEAITGSSGLDMGVVSSQVASGSTAAEINSHAADYIESTAEATYSTSSGHHSMKGTLVIQSTMAGNEGKIAFAGSEDILKALSLTEIQEPLSYSALGSFNVSVVNAHSGTAVGSDRIAEPVLKDVISGVDVQIDARTDILTSFDSNTGKIEFAADSNSQVAYLHVVDTSVNIHIGANENQTLNTTIGQMDTKSLNIENVTLVSVEESEKAITYIDNAINQVSSERSKLGSYINRLDHTIKNLGVSAENLKATESAIRDLDFAAEMVQFTKYQVLSNASNSLLAQANALSQNVLTLLR